MKHFDIKLLMLALCAAVTFSACEKAVIDEDINNPSAVGNNGNGSASLTVTTRSGGDSEATVAEGRIYIFNQSGSCVDVLSTNEEKTTAAVQLAAGTYTLYSIGGDDLSRFTLPTKSTATATSIISRQEGKVMDELLMKTSEVTLEDGDVRNLTINLDRKVLCLDEVKITDVPTTVTKVEVALSSFYSTVQLNGTHPATPTETYKVALTKQSDNTTWKANPQQLLFPTKDAPTIAVSLTMEAGSQGVSYTAANAMQANHHYTIACAYNVAQGGQLSCTLTAAAWGEDQTITFDLDESNTAFANLEAGSFCNGWYVVSVNDANRTAVLLSKAEVDYEAPAAGSAAAAWSQALTTAMAGMTKPAEATGNWRLPTTTEAAFFTPDGKAIYQTSNGGSITIFCQDDETLKWGYVNSDRVFKSGTSGFVSGIYLRPVIDIAY